MDTIVYAGRLRNREVLKYASSGGAFTALSDEFLSQGNAVLCSGYNYRTHQAEFRLVLTAQERDKCRGSMYMQSFASGTWREAIDWLKNNPEKQLLFVGVGCQGAGFLKYIEMKNMRDRVTIVDIICHGSPSPMIWKEYIHFLERKGKISDINLRDKRTGWNKSTATAKQNDKEISLMPYRRLYSSRTTLRPCCSECPYTTTERCTDITIGDFWHIEKSMPDFFDDMGTSVFLIHTEKGNLLFEKIKSKLDYRQSNTKDCWQMNLEKPTEHSKRRDVFWNDYRYRGIEFVIKKYGDISTAKKVMRKIKALLKK